VFPKHIIGRNEITTRLGFASQDLQSQETQDTEYRGSSSDVYWAQSFQPGLTGTLNELELYLKVVEFYTGPGGWLIQPNMAVSIYSDDSGSPDSKLADFTDPGVNSFDYKWYTCTGSQAVTSGTTYWVVVDLYTFVKVDWGSNSGGGYASGSVKKSSDLSSWSADTGDSCFKAYTQPAASAYIDWDVTYKKRYV
jgi:hypothetical protein